ncbi:hypothetical protein EST54_16825 [Streptomyces sioyaensis]|uniref:Uncharacterized protein n=1 Tax=Streptomyces sioyaensis TaxID=67364 RepID=A0A4Q1R0N6_9ACTN|nr:hypothetical protein EST54_16825 [Streptomyces sioyaensis]
MASGRARHFAPLAARLRRAGGRLGGGPPQWRPCAESAAPPKSRPTARKGRVTTVAMAPPIARITSAIALNMGGPPS